MSSTAAGGGRRAAAPFQLRRLAGADGTASEPARRAFGRGGSRGAPVEKTAQQGALPAVLVSCR